MEKQEGITSFWLNRFHAYWDNHGGGGGVTASHFALKQCQSDISMSSLQLAFDHPAFKDTNPSLTVTDSFRLDCALLLTCCYFPDNIRTVSNNECLAVFVHSLKNMPTNELDKDISVFWYASEHKSIYFPNSANYVLCRGWLSTFHALWSRRSGLEAACRRGPQVDSDNSGKLWSLGFIARTTIRLAARPHKEVVLFPFVFSLHPEQFVAEWLQGRRVADTCVFTSCTFEAVESLGDSLSVFPYLKHINFN